MYNHPIMPDVDLFELLPTDQASPADETGVYAAVVVNVEAPGLNQPFTYRVPTGLPVSVGDAVLVPFGTSGDQIGHVVGIGETLPAGLAIAKVKEIRARISGAESFDEELWRIAEWVAAQTLSDVKDVIKLIAPAPSSSQIKVIYKLSPNWRLLSSGLRQPGWMTIIEELSAAPDGTIEAAQLTKNDESLVKAAAALRRKGAIEQIHVVVEPKVSEKRIRVLRLCTSPDVAVAEASRIEARSPKQAKLLRELIAAEQVGGSLPTSGVLIDSASSPTARSLASKGLAAYHEISVRRDPFGTRLAQTVPPPLNDEQTIAARAISAALTEGPRKPFLLYGVTGSGKTEVYLDAIAQARRQGRGSILILPEIALSAQVLDLLKARFGDDVAVLHSAISSGERFDEWRRIRTGAATVVVGARSAIFAPVRNLGLIVVDEEHEASYKQDSAPRYHARDVALERARVNGAVCVLGSATPSVDSFFRAKIGVYELLRLTKRVSNRPMPEVRLVDLRTQEQERIAEEKRVAHEKRYAAQGGGVSDSDPAKSDWEPSPLASVLSFALRDALGERLERGEQAIFFLNRRGFAPFLLCRDCGFAFRCPNCDVTLTFHRAQRLLQCHHCDYRKPAPDECPKCGGMKVFPFGIGTEKVEDAVLQAFPAARTLRMDRDTTARKGAHAAILRSFRRREADVLIGTQMVAKGLDFPDVTLVGVINADTGLNMPDFHAAERTFQLLAQVSGRAGRGERPGEVYIQTFDPAHESIVLAAAHDYEGFYYQEIVQRRDLRYPPFARLANIIAVDEVEEQASARCSHLADRLRAAIVNAGSDNEAQILGPVACPLARVRNRYRWHLMLRCATRPALLSLLRAALAEMPIAERIGLTIDIDPSTML
ncbi:MAG: primosomal protein N' [Capsulimonadaceae bacterium]|nr:primosomal protein N' [Capsulimonadaceae bacterium]